MTDEHFNDELERLKAAFGVVETSLESGQRLVRIADVGLPKGCSPSRTSVLLRLPAADGRPEVFAQTGIKVTGNKDPRNTSTVLVAGQSWMQFSYKFDWDEKHNTLDQFVAAALQRFAKAE